MANCIARSDVVPQYDIQVYQGDTFKLSMVWKDDDDNPIDLTGYTARMHIRAKVTSTNYLVELTELAGITLGGVAGTILIALLPAQTILTPLQNFPGVWDLEITNTAGEVSTLLRGNVYLMRQVTK